MTRYLLQYLAVVLVFLPLDALWLGLVARRFYTEQLGPLLLDQPRWGIALAFYLLYVVGLVIFAVAPGIAEGSWVRAAVLGALFGLFAYATYDLTNLATMKGFPVRVAAVDIVWGMVISGVSAGLGAWIAMRLFGVAPQ